MSAKKVPRGSFSKEDYDIHRLKMAEIIPVIHSYIGDGNGKTAPRNLNWWFPSLRGPRCNMNFINNNDDSAYNRSISLWDYENKVWKSDIVPNWVSSDYVRNFYTEGEDRSIGRAIYNRF